MISFRIRGTVKEQETGTPLPGLFVKAYDKDLLFDDLLGSDTTDGAGRFDILTEASDFRDLFEKRPDLYFKVYRADRTTLLHSTAKAVRWNVGAATEVDVLVPADRLHDPARARVALAGDDGRERSEFGVGEPLVVQAEGLRPMHTYDVTVESGGRRLFTSRLLTGRRGDLAPTLLWPQMGLTDPDGRERLTIEEAERRWAGREVTVTVASGGKAVSQGRVRLAAAPSRPLALATDGEGRLLNAFEVGTRPLHVTVRGLPFAGPARLFVAPRQHDWRTGDPLLPAALADGSPAVLDFEAPEGGRPLTLQVAPAAALRAGAYDFVVRPLRYGHEDNDAVRVLPSDVLASRLVTGVVVREPFWTGKAVLGGCVNLEDIACRRLPSWPYARFTDTFQVGEDVWAAIDPNILDPAAVGKMCALYVIPSKDGAAWSDSSLQHLPSLGGNAGAQRIRLQDWCVNANLVRVWPGANLVGSYDIVADLGNNQSDPAAFAPDHQYNTPLDMIDGYFVAGFRVVNDPGTLSEVASIGSWDYTESTVVSGSPLGSVTVQDEVGAYHDSTSPPLGTRTVPVRASVRFPADVDPAVPPTGATRPLVVIVHGNGHSYTSYGFLLEHLARNGFVAASIHLAGNMGALGRAHVLFHHIALLKARFGTRLQDNIGILGHSRGGEAVVKAARLNQAAGGPNHGINAVVALGPTDQYGYETMAPPWAKPYLVLYGSRDGDVAGWPSTVPWATPGYIAPQCAFAPWDRASGQRKSMVFVHGATHNGFITANESTGDPDNLSEAAQQRVTKAYANAFFRQHLRGEADWQGLFTGEWTPASVSADGTPLFVQYRDPTRRTVDDFETGGDWQASTIAGTPGSVTDEGTLPAPGPQEGKLCDYSASSPGLDALSPHESKGLRLRWDHAGDRLVFTIPAGQRDVFAYKAISVRLGQVVGGANPAGLDQDLRIALRDGAGNERAVRVSYFSRLPFPDQRVPISGYDLRKSALRTVRIPLRSYDIVCAGQPKVDLHDVVRVELRFSEGASGEILVDDVEFTE